MERQAEEVVETVQEALPEEAQPAQPQSPVKEVVANEHIAYRNNRYLMQHYRLDGIGQYNIFNEGTGKVISVGSVTGRDILKVTGMDRKVELKSLMREIRVSNYKLEITIQFI